MKPKTIAIDVASQALEVAVSSRSGRVTERHRLSRGRVLPFFRMQPKATVLLEACGSAHYWARELQALGHEVVLLPPHAVRPYVTRNKTDKTDAKAGGRHRAWLSKPPRTSGSSRATLHHGPERRVLHQKAEDTTAVSCSRHQLADLETPCGRESRYARLAAKRKSNLRRGDWAKRLGLPLSRLNSRPGLQLNRDGLAAHRQSADKVAPSGAAIRSAGRLRAKSLLRSALR